VEKHKEEQSEREQRFGANHGGEARRTHGEHLRGRAGCATSSGLQVIKLEKHPSSNQAKAGE
jgi:hypothetical protein